MKLPKAQPLHENVAEVTDSQNYAENLKEMDFSKITILAMISINILLSVLLLIMYVKGKCKSCLRRSNLNEEAQTLKCNERKASAEQIENDAAEQNNVRVSQNLENQETEIL